ncbi:acyl-CoA carboxylase subunit epsilon [Actinacidiphila acidipaludis]|uniref:Acyl-CoA carboxylase subunit epsilon n=1 Tax=Actinacidiphila acidipaludis TaxID=2873382 RepID=A0ABS7Q2B8_9ACTN|nr:acyl-CoA carboxylase subunit epsilon [Streptomyces acidipaludis]MBY8877287.1 acyl-CoA carboxylase subunit epsilon [Streptomyces acidipaludis]
MSAPASHANAPATALVGASGTSPHQAGTAAAFRVVRGDATPAELAALAVVLLSVSRPTDQGPDATTEPPRAAWHRPRHAHHRCPRSWRR